MVRPHGTFYHFQKEFDTSRDYRRLRHHTMILHPIKHLSPIIKQSTSYTLQVHVHRAATNTDILSQSRLYNPALQRQPQRLQLQLLTC
ncbi:hypothetical protein EUGRSUZ_K00444 [Eucalyptus grandis]|uniref:Uncharacterized protein n=2 Tax=Eucalyptus grandis TaxID=71139 RepID=A0ACC3IRZ3_EUCGR|nr:hypothetical protein EUGRSUZ_K00444 [Eucalyptus grandis]